MLLVSCLFFFFPMLLHNSQIDREGYLRGLLGQIQTSIRRLMSFGVIDMEFLVIDEFQLVLVLAGGL